MGTLSHRHFPKPICRADARRNSVLEDALVDGGRMPQRKRKISQAEQSKRFIAARDLKCQNECLQKAATGTGKLAN